MRILPTSKGFLLLWNWQTRYNRGQRTEVRGRRSEVRGLKKGVGCFDHAAEHLADFRTQTCKFMVLLVRDVTTVLCKVQRRIAFTILTVTVRKFANEVSLVSAFRPGLTQVQTHRT